MQGDTALRYGMCFAIRSLATEERQSVSWLVGWLIGWLVVRSVGRSIGLLVGWMVGRARRDRPTNGRLLSEKTIDSAKVKEKAKRRYK